MNATAIALVPVEFDDDGFFVEIDGEMVEQNRIVIDPDGDDETAISMAPSEDRADYEAALAAHGWVAVGDNQARRA
ncbi:hypothetical protein [Gordonia iterans]